MSSFLFSMIPQYFSIMNDLFMISGSQALERIHVYIPETVTGQGKIFCPALKKKVNENLKSVEFF